jgi:hypothetical protein
MAAILAIVERLLGVLLQVLGITQMIREQTQHTAREHADYLIEGIVTTAGLSIAHPTYGLAAAHTERGAILSAIAALNAPVLAAIAALPAGSSLPALGDITGGVWGELDPFSDSENVPYGQELANSHRWASFAISAGSVPATHSPFFNISYPPPSPDTIPSNYTWPQPDWGDIRRNDALVIWLERTCPDFTWSYDSSGENIIGYLTSLNESEAPHFTPRMTGTEWYKLIVAPLATAPIWPGQAEVTDGAPTVLTETAIVTGPMDGIKLTVDSGPGGAGQWGVGDFRSYYRAGYVVFLDADGHADTTQFVGPDDNIFAPKGMTTAASVVVGLNKATQITVTPWTLGATP